MSWCRSHFQFMLPSKFIESDTWPEMLKSLSDDLCLPLTRLLHKYVSLVSTHNSKHYSKNMEILREGTWTLNIVTKTVTVTDTVTSPNATVFILYSMWLVLLPNGPHAWCPDTQYTCVSYFYNTEKQYKVRSLHTVLHLSLNLIYRDQARLQSQSQLDCNLSPTPPNTILAIPLNMQTMCHPKWHPPPQLRWVVNQVKQRAWPPVRMTSSELPSLMPIGFTNQLLFSWGCSL